MQNVATLIADPARADLDDEDVAAVSDVLSECGAPIDDILWLDEGIACDVVFTGPKTPAIRDAVRAAFASAPFDIVIQPRQGRRKDLLIAAETQEGLIALGYEIGDIDGVIGGKSRGAIRSFQKTRGMKVTGTASESLIQALKQAAQQAGTARPD